MVLLDTDILIGFLRNNKEAVSKITQLLDKHIVLFTTAINTAELYFGAYLSEKSRENLAIVEKLVKTINILPFNLNNSKIYGEIRSDLQKKGELINELDIFIAAIAIEKDLPIISRNTKHFDKIMKLRVDIW